jgi:hypothetical protein
VSEHVPDVGSEYRVTIHDDAGLPQQESIDHVGQIAQDLNHPFLVGFAHNAGHLDMAGLQVHDNKHRVAHRTDQRHHFHLEKVHGRNGTPVRFQERDPRHVFAALRSRFNPVFSQDTPHGGSTDRVA